MVNGMRIHLQREILPLSSVPGLEDAHISPIPEQGAWRADSVQLCHFIAYVCMHSADPATSETLRCLHGAGRANTVPGGNLSASRVAS